MLNSEVFYIIQRRTYHADFTHSDILINKDGLFAHYCYGLEDVARPAGLKFAGSTCIAEGDYRVSVTHSNRFNKEMILLSNVPDHAVRKFGVEFTGVRVHGGNDVDDTDGCILAGYQTDKQGKLWQRASDNLAKLIKQQLSQGNNVRWLITS